MLSAVLEPFHSPNIPKAPGPIRRHFGGLEAKTLPKMSQLDLSHRQPNASPLGVGIQCLSLPLGRA